MSGYNKMQLVKRRFFAMRNGIIADSIRKAGFGYRMVFGLNLPQLVEIAADFAPDPELAEQLWADTRTRESRLLAPMLIDPSALLLPQAIEMAGSVDTVEVADILCHRLLRRRPDMAEEISEALLAKDEPLMTYTALRLWFNLLSAAPLGSESSAELTGKISPILKAIPAHQLTAPIARALAEELSFRPES